MRHRRRTSAAAERGARPAGRRRVGARVRDCVRAVARGQERRGRGRHGAQAAPAARTIHRCHPNAARAKQKPHLRAVAVRVQPRLEHRVGVGAAVAARALGALLGGGAHLARVAGLQRAAARALAGVCVGARLGGLGGACARASNVRGRRLAAAGRARAAAAAPARGTCGSQPARRPRNSCIKHAPAHLPVVGGRALLAHQDLEAAARNRGSGMSRVRGQAAMRRGIRARTARAPAHASGPWHAARHLAWRCGAGRARRTLATGKGVWQYTDVLSALGHGHWSRRAPQPAHAPRAGHHSLPR